MINRGFRFRLYPTEEQAVRLSQFAGATRFVYNLALEQRSTFWRPGRRFNYVTQNREVTQLRAEVPWLAEVSAASLTNALRDLDQAFAAFFAHRSGYPTMRTRERNSSFRVKGEEIAAKKLNRRWAAVRIPKIGWVRYRDTRPLRGRTLNATIGRDALGWHVCFACEIEHEAQPSALPSVGIDRGVANTIALSTGELLSTPATKTLERRKKRAQRILARRQRGSARYRKQRQRLSRITSKIARVRADWRHKATTGIADRFGLAAIEDLNTKGMTAKGRGKRGLNRSILEHGWHRFETTLAYKLEERGGTLVKINPAYTSQECSACGVTDKASRESQSRYACRHCGTTIHADTNAAINILRRSSPAMLVEGAGYGPAEARTVNHALVA
ncbi:RNA-guided endonuclease InsQ/TnpB family protein [Sphingomonas alba]|uniref:Transposase n=1 Tax=Sphingomonas alba TaxID=2908208 RepID=A0ABT0RLE8_9SPHN|nr:transposase [Sphingomonas alba]